MAGYKIARASFYQFALENSLIQDSLLYYSALSNSSCNFQMIPDSIALTCFVYAIVGQIFFIPLWDCYLILTKKINLSSSPFYCENNVMSKG